MDIKLEIDVEKVNRGFIELEKASIMSAKNMLNTVAALTRKNYINNAKKELTLRNNYTIRNIQFDKVDSIDINNMQSEVGATKEAPYMELQEKGGIRKPKGNGNLGIAQAAARGGSKARLISRNYYLRRLKSRSGIVKGKFSKRLRNASIKAQNVARAYVAFRENKALKFTNNIYTVSSFNKSRNRVHFKMKHIYNISQRSARIKGQNMLLEATKQPTQDAQAIYNSQMNKLLKSKEII